MAIWYCASDKWTAVTAWAALTAYNVGDIRRQLAAPTAGNERVWRCTTAGTSGAAEPTWTLTKGSTTNDGTAVWTEITGDATYNTNPSNMVAPHARMENAAAWMAAGDTLYIGNHHAQTQSTSVLTCTFPGTLAAPNYVYVVDDTQATPTLASGASITTTSTGTYTVNGCVHVEASAVGGFVFSVGSGAATGNLTLGTANSPKQVWKNVDYIQVATNPGTLLLGGASGGTSGHIDLYNFRLKFANAGTGLVLQAKVRIHNLSFISGGTAPTNLVKSSGNGLAYDAVFNGCDLSNMGTTSNLVIGGATTQIGNIVFQGCKLPASWSGLLLSTDYTVCGVRVAFHACATDDSMFAEQIQDVFGKIVQETATFVRSGGATIPNSKSGGTDPQPLSLKFSPNANCIYPGQVLKSDPIPVMDLVTGDVLPGVPITLTVHALADQVAAIKNNVFWIEVSYPGTAGSTLYTVTDNKPSGGLTTATALSAGSGWTTTGMTNPQQVISTITFTPQEKGVILVRICVGSNTPSTIYADPMIA